MHQPEQFFCFMMQSWRSVVWTSPASNPSTYWPSTAMEAGLLPTGIVLTTERSATDITEIWSAPGAATR